MFPVHSDDTLFIHIHDFNFGKCSVLSFADVINRLKKLLIGYGNIVPGFIKPVKLG